MPPANLLARPAANAPALSSPNVPMCINGLPIASADTCHAADLNIPPQKSTYGSNHLLKNRLGWLPTSCPSSPYYLDTLYQSADLAGNVIRAGTEHRDCFGSPTSQT